MTFSNRLRLTLVIIAVVPAILIAGIVVIGTSGQIKRIEYREATAGCEHFSELLSNTVQRIEKNIKYIKEDKSFRLFELKLKAKRHTIPQYQLPLLSLDFLEYIGADGSCLLSAQRPALVGRTMIPDILESNKSYVWYRYENDLSGKHPSVVAIVPTENGYLYGGIFLDGSFASLAQAVTRSRITFVENSQSSPPLELSVAIPNQQQILPYREQNSLIANLLGHTEGQYIVRAHFLAGGQSEIFTKFLTGVGAVTIVSLILALVAGMYFSAQAKREIGALTEGASRIASGDFSQPVVSAGEGEFYDLAESFNHMMKQLTEYRQKLIMTEKIAAWQSVGQKVAHEIKNPLTPIAIAADDLQRSFQEHQPDFENILTDCTGTIKHEVDRLKKLIDRFSSFAKMPMPEIKRFELAGFIDEISNLYKAEIDRGFLTIINNVGDSHIVADPDQLRQILINLIKNSIEASGNKCQLCFSEEDDKTIITIEDNGSGFPDRIINEGITPYYSTKADGTGLGLLICQRIVFDHNGVMSIENRSDGGARVTIFLPHRYA